MTEEQKKWVNKIYMLHENELWLNEQAEKGLILKKFDKGYAYFIEGAKENIKYKIVILNKKKAENQIKIIEHQGFTFLGSCDEYYIFCINGKYRHINLRFNEETVEFVRKWSNRQILKKFGVSIIAIASIILKIIFNRDTLFQSIVEIPTMLYILGGFIIIASLIDGISEYRAVIMTRKCFLEHEECLLDRISQKSNIRQTFIIVICILAAIFFIKYIYFNEEECSIDDVQKVMPIVLLQDIEQNKGLSQIITDSQNTLNEDNYAEVKHTILAPKQYYAWQKSFSNDMRIHYYEVAVDQLAEPLARELPINEMTDIEKMDFVGLDAVYTWQNGGFVYVSACKGKRVMLICNIGDIKMEDIMRKMADVL